MKNLNQQFFEEYKKLDKLCKEIYGVNVGITNYIDDMKAVSNYEKSKVMGFELSLKHLIAARHLRNQLSHDVGAFDSDLCDEADIKFVKEFREAILNHEDPLSKLYALRKKVNKDISTPLRKSTHKTTDFERTPQGFLKAVGAFIVFIVLFALSVIVSSLLK